MGTSARNPGEKSSNPKIPTWVEEPVTPEEPDDNRLTGARSHFTTFTNSGGDDDNALGCAVASYIGRASGGPRLATLRMKSEREASVELCGILSEASKDGIQNVIERRGLAGLDGYSPPEIYVALVDKICPTDGNRDDSMARAAYLDAITEVAGKEGVELAQPSPDAIKTIRECFIRNAIKNRMLNAVGMKFVIQPKDVGKAQKIDNKLNNFIDSVISGVKPKDGNLTMDDIGNLYERCFTALEARAKEDSKK